MTALGVTGNVKAVIGESSHNSNQALGISVLSCAWGIGLIAGPAVGGTLSDPINQYHLNVSGMFILFANTIGTNTLNVKAISHYMFDRPRHFEVF